ncbi:putative CAP domain-containing protein [Helianthus annuus]|nr:putative CAP domain-containing protein [Helianthus annuus]
MVSFKLQYALIWFLIIAIFHSTHAQNSQTDYLNAHNTARAQVGVGNMVWNTTLATFAQNYANRRIQDCNLVDSNGPYGENLAKGRGSFIGTAAVNLWVNLTEYDDKHGFVFDAMMNKVSQMIKWVYKIVSSSSHSNPATSSKSRMRVVLPTADNHCRHKPHITKKKGNIFRVHQLIRKDFLKALLFGFLDSISISMVWGFIRLLVTKKVFSEISFGNYLMWML